MTGRLLAVAAIMLLLGVRVVGAQDATLRVEVRSETGPVRDAEVLLNGARHATDAQGVVLVTLAPGRVEIVVVKPGFAPASAVADLNSSQQSVRLELTRDAAVEEHVTVSATRTDRGIDDQPMRVEVLDQEEIDEKAMMTPGDVVMMLNEMGGMRVQATSPSLGAASVRIQGMRGRYTRFLSDGLPLFGEQVSLGLMQIPPLDLGRVEVIKGVASSLYGAGAMSGVVNLVSRRPGERSERQFLFNRSAFGSTDVAAWHSGPLSGRWGLTFLGSVNGQPRVDVDDDGWADRPKYERVVARPRLFWDDQHGRTFFATVGGTWEDRIGGTLPEAALPAGGPYVEGLETRRYDVGAAFQSLSGSWVWSVRGSWSSRHQQHQFGEVVERDDRDTGFAEFTARRSVGPQTIVAGAAIERDRFDPIDTPRFAFTFTTPGVFVQDDVDLARWLSVSASARLDRHSAFGVFVSPRISGLIRRGPWSSRVSYGRGFFAPTPITEETEAAGLSRLTNVGALEPERGISQSFDVTRAAGPLSLTLTLFHSRVEDPIEVERTGRFTLANLASPTTNTGLELLGVWKSEGLSVVGNYAYVRSREEGESGPVAVPLTPEHSIGVDAAWEWEERWRLGVEWYYTGRQRLEANPYRAESEPYQVFGILISRRVRGALFFLNGENLTDVRQTHWDPLLRPTRGVDGRWAVDSWAPLDGRAINGGVRVTF